MGRVLSYSIKKDKGNFTMKELTAMYEVSKFYNSKELLNDINTTYKKKLKGLWSCESFWLGIGNFYPNWENSIIKNIKDTVGGAWKLINDTLDKYENEIGYIEGVFKLKKEGFINFHDEDYHNSFHGFTKTQGNEFNSLLVFKALIEISKRIPTATLNISDEGEFLLCPLKIKKGKVLPNVNDLVESMQYYCFKTMFSKEYKGNILSGLKYEGLGKIFKDEIGLENTYGDMTKYINDKLRNLIEVEKAIKKGLGQFEQEYEMMFYNLNQRECKNWFKPELFIRPVNVEKFLEYQMTPGTMMDGFHGEGFGLTDKDSEAESYRMTAHIFSMLGNAGFDRKNVHLLGEENEQ